MTAFPQSCNLRNRFNHARYAVHTAILGTFPADLGVDLPAMAEGRP